MSLKIAQINGSISESISESISKSISGNKKRSRDMDVDIDIDFDKKLRLGTKPTSSSQLPRNFITEYYQRQKSIDENFVDKDQQIIEMQKKIEALEKEVATLKSNKPTDSCYCQNNNPEGYYWNSVVR